MSCESFDCQIRWGSLLSNYARRGEMLSELEAKLRTLRIERDNLLERDKKLASLEAAGVDNWEGYSQAARIRAEWAEEDDEDGEDDVNAN